MKILATSELLLKLVGDSKPTIPKKTKKDTKSSTSNADLAEKNNS